MANFLKNSTSPYLLQHADNPVQWYPWSQEALDRAREENKPIFLSIGYAACHWCHVMAHESFEDLETAAVMNEHFINIKVDREERPDIDSVYMDAVVAMTGQGGWPMSLFLTPDGKPFYGGTYFPPVARFNMPSFRSLLLKIADEWQNHQEQLSTTAAQLAQHVASSPALESQLQLIDPATLDRAAEVLFNRYDWKNGGWGSAPKFPQSLAINFLFRTYSRSGDQLALDMATDALDKMARGGMYDLIGGGFHRYSVDDSWRVPHFEKMLYDNALLLISYAYAWQITRQPRYRQIATQTLDFMKRELRDVQGGFYSSLDADSEGHEGTYYVWSVEEIGQILDSQINSDIFIYAYGFTSVGNFEGKNIPFQAVELAQVAEKFERTENEISSILQEGRNTLLRARDQRQRPGLDDKVLTSWNGLTLSALCAAARIFSDENYLQAAQGLAFFLIKEMFVDGKLMRSWRQGKANLNAYLEDHAALATGLLDLYQIDFNPRWYTIAVEQALEIIEHFSDPRGGFFDTRDDHEILISRPKSIQDTPIPSGNSLCMSLFLRLGALSGSGQFIDPAEAALRAIQENAAEQPSAFAQWLNAIDFAVGPQLQLAIVGSHDDSKFQDLARVAQSLYLPRLVMAGGPTGSQQMPALMDDRSMVDNQPTAYLCRNFSCNLPTTSPEVLAQQIEDAISE